MRYVAENRVMPRGRKPVGQHALSNAERQVRHRVRRLTQPVAITMRTRRPIAIYNQIRFVRRLSRWLLIQGLVFADLRVDEVDRFLSAPRSSGHKKFRLVKAMRPVLAYLWGISAAPPPATAAVRGPVDLLPERYCRHLLVERAVATSTARLYTGDLRPTARL